MKQCIDYKKIMQLYFWILKKTQYANVYVPVSRTVLCP